MGEIRLCARLNHPKIVIFIGITYTSLCDLMVVIEYMSGGDLESRLRRQLHCSSPKDWHEPSSVSGMKSKLSVTLGVIQAIVYLHPFEGPIVHRDLKPRSVLLDDISHAKLSDFGICREVSFEDTMTGEVGTLAWIASEVLKGLHYNEKADIYSFGVLLVEMDKCQHPYANQVPIRAVQ